MLISNTSVTRSIILNHLRDQIPINTSLEKRDTATMELFYSSGIRLKELVSIDLEHLARAYDAAHPHAKKN